jgi:hypothetical protein
MFIAALFIIPSSGNSQDYGMGHTKFLVILCENEIASNTKIFCIISK